MYRTNAFSYLFSKLLNKLQFASRRQCDIARGVKIGARSNLIYVKMGAHSFLGPNSTVCNAEIGKYCSVAGNCSIGAAEHPLDALSSSPAMYTAKQKARYRDYAALPKTVIGNDVWIGEACFLKSGVTVGTGAVVGAHSVVTKDIPPYAVAVGVPAKVIRYRFDEPTRELLLRSEWWNWSEKEAADFRAYAETSDDFVPYLQAKEVRA